MAGPLWGWVGRLACSRGHLVEGGDAHCPTRKSTFTILFRAQLKTTSNFNTRAIIFLDCWWTQLSLGTLFPHVATSTSKLSPDRLRATAHEFGLPYHEFGSFLEAQRSHLSFLKKLGKEQMVADPVLI